MIFWYFWSFWTPKVTENYSWCSLQSKKDVSWVESKFICSQDHKRYFLHVIRTLILLKIIITKKGAQVRKSEFQRNVGIIKMQDQLDIVAPVKSMIPNGFWLSFVNFHFSTCRKFTLCPFREGISQNSKFVMYENMTYERTRGIWVCNCIKLVH